jgi:hypothetical protein
MFNVVLICINMHQLYIYVNNNFELKITSRITSGPDTFQASAALKVMIRELFPPGSSIGYINNYGKY